MSAFSIILISLSLIVGILAILFLIWLFLVFPARFDDRIEKFKKIKYAHRGLHGDGACENSLTAFRRAVDSGFGIELDVRLSSDGVPVVFHDATLSRVAGIDKKVSDLAVSELGEVRLGDTDDCVPTFREVLDLVAGRVPLLIEIKMDASTDPTPEKLLREIDGYEGDYIVESFNPAALCAVRRARPDIMIGLLSMEYSKTDRFKGKVVYKCLELLLSNFLCRPNFIAYEKTGSNKKYLRFFKKLFGTVLFAWTVKSREEEKQAARVFDSVIFEQYIAEK